MDLGLSGSRIHNENSSSRSTKSTEQSKPVSNPLGNQQQKKKNIALSSAYNHTKKSDLSITASGLSSARSTKSIENVFLPNGAPRSTQSTARSTKSTMSSMTNVSSIRGTTANDAAAAAAHGDNSARSTNRTFTKPNPKISQPIRTGAGGSKLSTVSSQSSTRTKSRGAELDTFLDLKQLQSSEDVRMERDSMDPTAAASVHKWVETLMGGQENAKSDRSNWNEIAVASNRASPVSHRAPSFPLGLYDSETSLHNKWKLDRDNTSEVKVMDIDVDGASESDDLDYVPGNDSTPRATTIKQSQPSLSKQSPEVSHEYKQLQQSIVILREERAARKIQVWYRRHMKRRRAAQAAMQRMMTAKKKELIAVRSSVDKPNNEEKKQRRKQQERQKAIEELQRRREEKRSLDKMIAESEVNKLKAEGKIVSTTSARSSKSKASAASSPSHTARSVNLNPPSATEKLDSDRSNSNRLKSLFAAVHERDAPDRDAAAELQSSRTDQSHHTTLDDILSTLRELEEVDMVKVSLTLDGDKTPRNNDDRKNAWMDDIDKLLKEDNMNSLTVDKLREHDERMRMSAMGMSDMEFQRQSRLGDVAAYLRGSSITSNDKISAYQVELDAADLARLGQEMEKSSRAAMEEVSSHVLSQKLELEERRRTVAMLQKALQQQRELTLRQVHETQQDWERRMEVLQREHQATVERNYGLIDQLIDEKKVLQEKCDSLVNEVKNLRQKTEEKIRQMEEKHVVEIKKIDAKHAAAEKLRREKWESDKTRLIKEMTVKGMEAEIAQLIAGHKAELRKLKQQMEESVLQADERAYSNYGRQVDELRHQLTKEKEEACLREREMAKMRYESQLETETVALEAQRRRLYAEVQDEKERLAHLAAKQKNEQDSWKRDSEELQHKTLDSWRREFERSRNEQELKHKSELDELKHKLQLEKESWEQNFLKEQETQLMMKEREMRSNLRKERDREIDMVLERLEMDTSSAKEECERAAENKIKRVRDKYEAEMEELERSERVALEKYNQMKASMLDVQGENDRLKVMLKQKEQEIEEVRKLYEKLNREREFASDIIRQEFADRLVATDEENRRLKIEMSELRARLGQEAERSKEDVKKIELEKEKELEAVHKKVKEAIRRKEENLSELKNQYQQEMENWKVKLATAMKRSEHLEGLLEQQRQQLLALKR